MVTAPQFAEEATSSKKQKERKGVKDEAMLVQMRRRLLGSNDNSEKSHGFSIILALTLW
jgi:hypothetical protein